MYVTSIPRVKEVSDDTSTELNSEDTATELNSDDVSETFPKGKKKCSICKKILSFVNYARHYKTHEKKVLLIRCIVILVISISVTTTVLLRTVKKFWKQSDP
jgi:hypothetical protein